MVGLGDETSSAESWYREAWSGWLASS
jgi:hypothetical protein